MNSAHMSPSMKISHVSGLIESFLPLLSEGFVNTFASVLTLLQLPVFVSFLLVGGVLETSFSLYLILVQWRNEFYVGSLLQTNFRKQFR